MRAQSIQNIGVQFIVHFQDFGIEQIITTIHGGKMQKEGTSESTTPRRNTSFIDQLISYDFSMGSVMCLLFFQILEI
jgi:hypothetical protein